MKFLRQNLKLGIFLIVQWCLVLGCKNNTTTYPKVDAIPIPFTMHRFDQEFANLNAKNLQKIKQKYPYLFPKKFPDSVWIKRAKDTLQIEIQNEVDRVFGDFEKEKGELRKLFQHIRYYFPEVRLPKKVITVISDIDYKNKIVLRKDLLILSLDNYLGSSHYFYKDIQVFLKKNFEKAQLTTDIATAFAKKIVPLPKDRSFLSNMIYYGKTIYLQHLFLPYQSSWRTFGYSQNEWNWAIRNEKEIWRYFIDRQLLYSTDRNLASRFLYPAPFSKFYLEKIDREAPDRIGQYIGWRIVNDYMKNNNLNLGSLLKINAEKLFKTSQYKPQYHD